MFFSSLSEPQSCGISIVIMASNKLNQNTIPQSYPRIEDENRPDYGCLDDSTLIPHKKKISIKELKPLILSAIQSASRKSGREILSIPSNASEEEIQKIYRKQGNELFKYFRKYCGDPAATAHQVYKKHYRDVCTELFRNRTLQKERMNSGWRYQYLALDCAVHSGRFRSVSDIGAAEADFNAIIEFLDKAIKPLNLYVSIKNRSDTLGGQDWPKAIQALEKVARTDKNRMGAYCCVFGIAMDRGFRRILREQKSKNPHSVNTEVWLSDFFWPFFANYSYEEIMNAVLDVLIESQAEEELPTQLEIPDVLLDAFGEACIEAGLVDELGRFNDPHKLVQFFCQLPAKQSRKKVLLNEASDETDAHEYEVAPKSETSRTIKTKERKK
jgi:hypothetical protein